MGTRCASDLRARVASSGRYACEIDGSPRSSGPVRSFLGQELLQYLDEEGKPQDVTSSDVNTYLKEITGDFVMIQDADLEYDLEDYEALLEPLLQNRAAFVLGSRHGGSTWKMRQFEHQPLVAAVLNQAHWFFTTLINVCFNATLKDPFTMYKVFRRDCVAGVTFESNRFDFDYELLFKIVRKGYRPIEIPVNYRSRTFTEGKKVSVTRDPWTWVCAILRFRRVDLNVLEGWRASVAPKIPEGALVRPDSVAVGSVAEAVTRS